MIYYSVGTRKAVQVAVVNVAKHSVKKFILFNLHELTLEINPTSALIKIALLLLVHPLVPQRAHTEKSPLHVRNVENSSLGALILLGTNLFTLEKSPMNAKNVENLSAGVLISLDIKRLTLVRSRMNAKSVGSPSAGSPILSPTKELTQEINCIHAINVGKPLCIAPGLPGIRGLTLEKNPMSVLSVGSHSDRVHISFCIREHMSG